MTLAWFSPLPPVRSGISAYSAELLPLLARDHVIDTYPAGAAHDFVWRNKQRRYDLVVYQLGNSPSHDYMWAYLARYPGLVVLHDARLHHSRARALLQRGRVDDYRREFRFDRPDARPDVTEYAVEGLGGTINYLWRMVRVVMATARLVCVHDERVASELRDEYPTAAIDTIRMGVPAIAARPDDRTAIRARLHLPDDAIVFAVFGKVTAEKRIVSIASALATLVADGRLVYLLVIGDGSDDAQDPAIANVLAAPGIADRVRVTGYVEDDAVGAYLTAADACLCLRWPTAQETSASWLRCLAAGKATVITDLAHLVDVPDRVALRVDLLDEVASLTRAMRRLADDRRLRDDLGRDAAAYHASRHTLEAMADDYRRVLARAAARPAPAPADLPAHFTDDYSEPAQAILRRFGLHVDIADRDASR